MEILRQLAWPQGLANYVTLFRIALAGPLVYFILQDNLIGTILVFLIAAVTDGIDGWVARKMNIISDLGKILDPVADKILIISTFTSRIVFLHFWLSWIFLPILLEEIALIILGTVGFCYREKIGQRLGSNWFGKFKFVSHCFIAFFLLVFPASHYQGLSIVNLTIISLAIVATILGGLSITGHIRDQKEFVRKALLRR
ncbi:MAG: CDP-alcohol phosphatidyltransferase family protein [Patescibacteria group bacterium]|nr:CDP-alcohol phosphatidyltransferase family protein [Patescibacteria group bacterium]